MMALVSTLVQLAIVIAIGTAIAKAVRNRGGGRQSAGDNTASLRRLFTYGLLAVAVGVAASGVWGLLSRLFDAPEIAGDARTTLARSLAFTIVGLPAAIVLFRSTLRRLAMDPEEEASAGWRLYIGAATTISLLGTMIAAYVVVAWMVGLEDADGEAVAWLLVMAALWVIHWQPAVHRHHPPSGIHLMLGTLLGWGAVVGSAGVIIGRTLDRIYVGAFGTAFAATDFGEVLGRAAVVLAVGAAAWAWHWLMPDRSRWSETMWHGWVLIGGVLSGVLALLGSAGAVLLGLAVWIVGDAGGESAAAFFDFIPATAATALVASVSVAYHYSRHAAVVTSRTEPARAFDYLLAAVGLAAGLSGFATLLVALFGTAGTPVGSSESQINVLLAALVAFVLGVPLWWRFWRRAEGFAVAQTSAELGSISRRTFIVATLGVAGITGLVAGIGVVFLLFEHLLEGSLGLQALYEMRVPLALVITAGAAAWYHWTVFRSDQDRRPAAGPARKRVVVVAEAGGAFAGELEEAIGALEANWVLLGEQQPVERSVAAVAAAIESAPGDDVLVLVGHDGEPVVVPYRTG